MLDFDGVAEFWFDSLEDWADLHKDPEFAKAIAGELQRWKLRVAFLTYFAGDELVFTKPPLHVTAGYDYLFVDNIAKSTN